jgi:tRNA threonylcarbamoyl adenosine modification protein (Sua5/YciO/YrdC/YwlC family)
MSTKLNIHPVSPPKKRIFEVADALKAGAVVLIPTESQFALACMYSNKKGLERIRKMRDLDKDHTFTLLIDSMNGISNFAQVSDLNFKLIKRLIPGPFTFIMPATKFVPKLLLHPRRKTIGFRVSGYNIVEQIISELGEPLLAVSAISDKHPILGSLTFRDELFDFYHDKVDLIVNDHVSGESEELQTEQTSVINLTEEPARVHRQGLEFDRVEEVFTIMNYELDVEEAL